MDLVVRLLLNSQNFNDNIKGSSKQLKQFENASKSIKNIIGKVGGALGIGVTAFQIFNKGMKSTQLTSDNFDNAINSAKTTVDTFFYSLVSGDWKPFEKGLLSSIRNAKNLSAELDDLEDKNLSFNYINAEDNAYIDKQMSIATDKSLSNNIRKSAAVEAKSKVSELKESTNKIIEALSNSIISELKVKLGESYSIDEIKHFMKSINMGDDKNFNSYKDYISDKTYKNRWTQKQASQWFRVDNKDKYTEEEFSWYERMYKLFNDSDENRKAMFEKLTKSMQLESSIYNKERSVNRQIGKFLKDDIIPEGSIKELENQIKKAKDDVASAISDSARVEAQKLVDSLEKELEQKNLIIKVKILQENNTDITPLNDVNIRKKYGGIVSKPEIKNGEESVKLSDETLNSYESFNTLLGATNSLIGVFSGEIENSVAGWAKFVSGLLTSIGGLISAFGALTVSETAAGTAAQSALPFPYNIVAMGATVAGVVATIASIPQFAEGGLVYGNTIAQVGEYSGASSNPEVIAPLSKLKSIIGSSNETISNVTFTIKGKELVGVLNNYNKQTSKVK